MTQRKPATVKQATHFVKKWAPAFGLSHYSISVSVLPDDQKGKVWGRSFYNVEEEWASIEVVPDGVLPRAVVESLVLHELAHGLLEFADHGDSNVEVACNRIARMVVPSLLCNEWHNIKNKKGEWYEDEIDLDNKWVKLLVDGLRPDEKQVVNALFYERRSVRATAAELGVSPRTVGRIRLRAVTALRAGLRALGTEAA